MVAKRDSELIAQIIAKARSVTSGTMATPEVCEPVLEYGLGRFNCLFADVWSVDPRRGRLILAATRYQDACAPHEVELLRLNKSLMGTAVAARRITSFDTTDFRDRPEFSEVKSLRGVLPNGMLSVPVLNTSNPNHVLCVLNFLTQDDSHKVTESQLRRLQTISTVLSSSIESNLRERAFRSSMLLRQALASHENADRLTISQACSFLAKAVCKAIGGDLTVVYVRDSISDRMMEQASARSGRSIDLEKRFGNSEHVTPPNIAKIAQLNREYLVTSFDDEDDEVPSFLGSRRSVLPDASGIFVPLQDIRGACHGVIACVRNPTERSHFWRFSYDHIAVLEAMGQAFVQPLETLLAAAKRNFSQQKITHELRVPVSAFREILSRMKRECEDQDFRFRHDHFKEGAIYVDLMKRLVQEMDLARHGPSEIPLRNSATNMQAEVVLPALRFTQLLLRERRMATWQFETSGFERFPKLMIDPALITQVVFNLLDNAIKHFDGTPRDFRCKVDGRITAEYFEICVSDNGPGIRREELEHIFSYGGRGSNIRANAFGEGLGLWISAAVAKRHRGTLEVRSLAGPTEIVLRLPRSVQYQRRSISGL